MCTFRDQSCVADRAVAAVLPAAEVVLDLMCADPAMPQVPASAAAAAVLSGLVAAAAAAVAPPAKNHLCTLCVPEFPIRLHYMCTFWLKNTNLTD